jgi:c-di-GMP-related signal transduction protein
MATGISVNFSGDCGGEPLPGASHVSDESAPEYMRYVARQPIMDLRGSVHGYELLFRAGPTMTAFSGDGNAATRTMLDNTVLFGLEKLTCGRPAFVNCTEEALLGRLVMVLPAEQTVLEILETLKPTSALFEACRDLKKSGFRLALDDFEWTPAWKPFAELADYIKVDRSKTSFEERMQLLRRLKGCKAQLLAERVETQAEFEQLRSEGFTLFQGYYFCRPTLVKNREIPGNRLKHLEMLQILGDEPLDILQMSNLVKLDASLTYRLLRMVNSPLYGTRKEVRSIHNALVLIGDQMFRRVAMLAIASELKGDYPTELLRMAFLRGRFCELAAIAVGQNPTEQYLLGILSLLNAMMRVPMESLVKGLPLRDEVKKALLGEKNIERGALNWMECYERGEWELCDTLTIDMQLPKDILPEFYTQALTWVEQTMDLSGH